MSDYSLTLVLQIKTSKIINDMAKVQQKSEKISAFGGIFFVLDKFDRILSSVIDSHLGGDKGLVTVTVCFAKSLVDSCIMRSIISQSTKEFHEKSIYL